MFKIVKPVVVGIIMISIILSYGVALWIEPSSWVMVLGVCSTVIVVVFILQLTIILQLSRSAFTLQERMTDYRKRIIYGPILFSLFWIGIYFSNNLSEIEKWDMNYITGSMIMGFVITYLATYFKLIKDSGGKLGRQVK